MYAPTTICGKELREVHLMRSPKVNKFVTTYPVAGSNKVEKITHKDGSAWINAEQFFGKVPEVAWTGGLALPPHKV